MVTPLGCSRRFAADVAPPAADNPTTRPPVKARHFRGTLMRTLPLHTVRMASASLAEAVQDLRTQTSTPIAQPVTSDELETLQARGLSAGDARLVRGLLTKLASHQGSAALFERSTPAFAAAQVASLLTAPPRADSCEDAGNEVVSTAPTKVSSFYRKNLEQVCTDARGGYLVAEHDGLRRVGGDGSTSEELGSYGNLRLFAFDDIQVALGALHLTVWLPNGEQVVGKTSTMKLIVDMQPHGENILARTYDDGVVVIDRSVKRVGHIAKGERITAVRALADGRIGTLSKSGYKVWSSAGECENVVPTEAHLREPFIPTADGGFFALNQHDQVWARYDGSGRRTKAFASTDGDGFVALALGDGRVAYAEAEDKRVTVHIIGPNGEPGGSFELENGLKNMLLTPDGDLVTLSATNEIARWTM